MSSKFRKKPVVIEAIEFKGKENWAEVNAFIGDAFQSIGAKGDNGEESILGVRTNHGTAYAVEGDWIIKNSTGEIYPCVPAIFEDTYDKVKESDTPIRRTATIKDKEIILSITNEEWELLEKGVSADLFMQICQDIFTALKFVEETAQ